MRRVLLVLIALLAAGLAFSQTTPTVVVAKSNTYTWPAAPNILSDGTPVPSGAVITYDLVSRAPGGTALTVLTSASALTATITYPVLWVPLDVGIRTDMTIGGQTLQSVVAWGSAIGLPAPFTVFPGVTPSPTASLTVK